MGITFLTLTRKVNASILLLKLGFRRNNAGLKDQLFTLAHLFEGLWELANPSNACFVDLGKKHMSI